MICIKCNTDKNIAEFYTSFKKARNKFETYKTCRKCAYVGNKQFQIKRRKDEIENLKDNYIKDKLQRRGLPKMPELIEIQRYLIILLRTIKQVQNEKN